jgi:hypothetical protein
MAPEAEDKTAHAKISPGFAARLEQLGPDDEVHAIVMLRAGDAKPALKSRPTKKARRATLKSTKEAVTVVLPVIDRILKRHHGRRLKSDVDALGAVPVITTPTGINALTGLEHVKAIIEDQPLIRIA